MLRDLTSLVTHEDSDVASYSASAIVNERRVASSTIELPSCEAVESHTSTASQLGNQVPFAPLCRACIVGRGREAPQPFHLGGAVSVSVKNADRVAGKLVTMFIEQDLWRVVPSDSNTMSNLGLASIFTEDVRVHGAWSEFLNKFPDRKNVTLEETDGGLDRSHESLGAAFKMRQKRETLSR